MMLFEKSTAADAPIELSDDLLDVITHPPLALKALA